MNGEKWTSLEREVFENNVQKPPSVIQQILIAIFGKKRTIEAIEQQKYLHNKKNKTS